MNPLTLFIAWRARRKARKALEAAERRRTAIASQIAHRASKHRERAYLFGDLKDATCRSLAASAGREWVR